MEYKPLSVVIIVCLLGASCCWGQEPLKAEQSLKGLGAQKAEQSRRALERQGSRGSGGQSFRGSGIQGSRASWTAARRSGGEVVCKQDGFELRRVNDSLYWLNDWQLAYPVYQFQTGDIDGDGRTDAIVGVIKSTRFYPEKARRLFIFKQIISSKGRQEAQKPLGQDSEQTSQSAEQTSQSAERISKEKQASTLQTTQTSNEILARPLWMGSKLGGILEDFRFCDGGIRALESTTDSLYSVADYKWAGFGMSFERFIIKGTDRQTAIKHLSNKPQ